MRVSAIIPCYNYGKYLPRAIDSILAQTRPVSEILVVDDGSTDNTREVATSYGDRVQYIFQQNQGRAAARNHGMREATGDWIALLDADDWWFPEKIELQLKAAAARPEAVLVYTGIKLSGDRSRPPLARIAILQLHHRQRIGRAHPPRCSLG